VAFDSDPIDSAGDKLNYQLKDKFKKMYHSKILAIISKVLLSY